MVYGSNFSVHVVLKDLKPRESMGETYKKGLDRPCLGPEALEP